MPVGNALPGLLVAGALAAAALSLPGTASPLAIALVAGVALANTYGVPERLVPGMRIASSTVMRVGVVLLGLSLTADAVVSLGWRVLLLVLVSVATTLRVVVRLGATLGVPGPAALLVAAGFRICGTSAISAVAPLTQARREEVAYAVGLVTLCGTLSVAAAAPADPARARRRRLRSLGGRRSARHRAGRRGRDAGRRAERDDGRRREADPREPARGARHRPRGGGQHHCAARSPARPAAVRGRLRRCGALAAAGAVPPALLDLAAPAHTALLVVGMVGLGSAVRLQDLRRLGLRRLILGLVSWVLLVGGTLLGVKAVVE